MFWDILTIGTFWFWLYIFASYIILTYIIEGAESGPGATTFLVFSLFVLFALCKPVLAIFSPLLQDPWKFFGYAGFYIVIGTVYAVYKWYVYCLQQRDKFIKSKCKKSDLELFKPDVREYEGTFIR